MKLTPAQHFQAKQWAAERKPVSWIANQFGCNHDTVKRVIDPEWRARRNLGIKLAKQDRNDGHHHGDGMKVTPIHRPPAEVLAERDRILFVDRTPNQEVLGDPLPGRSALDRMRGAHV